MTKELKRIETIELSSAYLSELIENRESFEVWTDWDSIIDDVMQIEEEIESQQLTCRIYTKGRWMAALSGLFSYKLGLATAVGLVAHNILTRNPDYEICRDIANTRIIVTYQN